MAHASSGMVQKINIGRISDNGTTNVKSKHKFVKTKKGKAFLNLKNFRNPQEKPKNLDYFQSYF